MMKVIQIFAVLTVTCALSAPSPLVKIGADNLLLNRTSHNYQLRNDGLAGFGRSTVGGAGGAVWTVFDPWTLKDALESPAPRIVNVRGRIDLTQMFTGSPGVTIRVGSYKTIIGGDQNAEITGGGFHLTSVQHVIVQNIKFSNAINYAPGEQPNGQGGILWQQPGAWSQIDNLDMNESENVWVDHCEFSDDPWNALATPESSRRHNGLLTIKRRSSYITVSNNIFRNHNMNFLIGHNDDWVQDIGRLRTTMYLNWFQGVVQRSPRVRYGEVHVLNNLYTDTVDYGIGVGAGARIYAERNAFVNTRFAWSMFSGSTPGALLNDGNQLTSSSHDAAPNNVNWHPSSYYGYSPMNSADVESHVRTYAGTF